MATVNIDFDPKIIWREKLPITRRPDDAAPRLLLSHASPDTHFHRSSFEPALSIGVYTKIYVYRVFFALKYTNTAKKRIF
jgi:hypothetical protein